MTSWTVNIPVRQRWPGNHSPANFAVAVFHSGADTTPVGQPPSPASHKARQANRTIEQHHIQGLFDLELSIEYN